MRPAIMFNRWQEDWAVLADPRAAREPLDKLKYIPLSDADPQTYLSFGADTRDRFESNNAQGFGIGGNRSQNYPLSRNEFHADLHVADQLQLFLQLQSDFAPWKSVPLPIDQNRLDLEQAFIAVTEPVGDGTLRLRLGRQQIGFDLQRFVSVRDGPNVRQSYDGAWTEYETGPWRFELLYSLPVQVRDDAAFDDYSSVGQQTFAGMRVERKLSDTTSISAYYAKFTQAGGRYANASGDERRDIFDVRVAGRDNHIDWDLEAMNQTGRIGSRHIEAWAFGGIAGYTFADAPWTPRLGIQIDAASGDSKSEGGNFGTFNPLFPNGAYLMLAGYTGYSNLVHVKPSLTLYPTSSVKVMLAAAAQWRENTADAIYTYPAVPVPNTAGRPGAYTGSYGQIRLDWTVDRTTSLALEAVHFAIGDALRRAGGRDANYVGVEFKRGW
ncbi:alginate export family protein [Rhizobium sp. ZPR3]|uniref:Alginate export family protein n=2 Tax=unclassified Rhizobium TaxID=2613769 RepID=A0AAU7SI83_9HYPH